MSSSVDKARAAWGASVPEWVLVLAAACDRSSQNAVASELSVSSAYLSWAIRNQKPQYHGMTEDAVRGRMMGEVIACPVLGDELAPDRCRELRTDRSRPLGPVAKQLRAACPSCRFNVPSAVKPEESQNAQ